MLLFSTVQLLVSVVLIIRQILELLRVFGSSPDPYSLYVIIAFLPVYPVDTEGVLPEVVQPLKGGVFQVGGQKELQALTLVFCVFDQP